MKRLKSLSIIILCLLFSYIFPVEKGSDIVVSVEPNATFPASDSNNKMLAFGWFKNGFELEDSTTSCTFESLFSVGGIVCLNGGELYLNSDLHFSNDTTFSTFGIIYANDHIMEYDSNNSYFSDPNNVAVMHDIELVTNADLTVGDTLRFEGDCIFNGRGGSITLSSGANIIIGTDSTLRVKNVVLKNISEDKIICADDSSKLILDNVKWIQTGDYTFSIGSLNIVNDVDFIGTHTFFYESTNTLTIGSNSTCKFTDQICADFGGKGGLNHNKSIWFVDSSSRMEVDNAKFIINPPGLLLTRGNFVLSKRADIEINSTTTADGLILGDGTVDGDLSIVCNPASYTYFSKGHWTYDMSNPNMIKSMSGFTKVVREDANTFYAKTNLTLSNITLKFSPYAPLLTSDGVEVKYDKCKVVIPGVKFGITGSRYTAAISLLDGNDEVFVEEGILPLYFLIKNSGNKIGGNGDLSGSIMFYDSDAQVSLNLDGQVSNDISLNGGKLTLLRDLEFAQSSNFSTGGIVDYSDKDIFFGSSDLTLTNTIYWDGNSGALNLKSKINLSGRWTFSGDCNVNGNGNILNLDGEGELVVERGSTLHLKNLKLYGITSDNVRALDENSKIILDNVKFVQDSDYTFSVGSLQILNKVNIFSPHSFYYESKQTLTIHKNSQLKFSDGAILAVGMLGNLDHNKPIWWEDSSSILSLDNAKIKVGDSGFRVYRGEVNFYGRVDIDVNSTTTMNGMILGDGSEDGDLEVIYNPASLVSFNTGTLTYDMVRSDGIKSMSNSSRISRSDGHYFYAKNNLYFDNITIEGSAFAVLDTVPGVGVGYTNCKMVIPGVKFGITGSRYNAYTSLLDGDDEIFLQEGVLPLWLIVKNSGNTISGNGSISGRITLNDSDAELTLNLDGQFLNNIILNDSKLILDRDSELSQGVMLKGVGTVDTGLHDLILGSADLQWTSTVYWDGNSGALSLKSKIDLSSKWTFSGDCHLHGSGSILDLGGKGEILVERGSTLCIKDLNIYGITNGSIRALGDDSKIILDNVLFVQDSDYTFSIGSLHILNEVDFASSYTFYYESQNTLIIHKNSQLKFSNESTLALGILGNLENNKPIWWEDSSSILSFDNSKIKVGDSGFRVYGGKIVFSGCVYIDINSTNTMNGMILGDGSESGDLDVVFNPASYVSFNSGALTYDMTKYNGIKSMSGYSKINRNDGQYFYVKRDLVFDNISISGSALAVLESAPGVYVGYNDCSMSVPGVKFRVTGSRYNAYSSLLNGDDEIFLKEGIYPLYTLVLNSGNSISGNGSISGQVLLNDADSELTLNLDGQFLNNIVMNNSKLILGKDTEFSGGALIEGEGLVVLGSNDLTLGSQDLSWTSTIYFDSSQSTVELNSMLKLYGTWTFSGNSILKGNNNILWLKSTGQIKVEKGSTLELQGVRIKALGGNKLKCEDDSGLIIFNACKTRLASNYNFEKGSFYIDYKFDVKGSYTFNYQSSQVSTIGMCSQFRFFSGTTFSYNPVVAKRDLFYMSGCDACFCFNDATLHSTTTGMQLTNGKISIYGDSYITSDATCKVEGIIFGDGQDENNDINIEVFPGATLDLLSGYLVYKNIN